MAGLCEGGNEPLGSLKANPHSHKLEQDIGYFYRRKHYLNKKSSTQQPIENQDRPAYYCTDVHMLPQRIPTRNTILRWEASFRIKGSTLKKKSPGRNSIALRLSEATLTPNHAHAPVGIVEKETSGKQATVVSVYCCVVVMYQMNRQNLHYEKCVKSYAYTFEKKVPVQRLQLTTNYDNKLRSYVTSVYSPSELRLTSSDVSKSVLASKPLNGTEAINGAWPTMFIIITITIVIIIIIIIILILIISLQVLDPNGSVTVSCQRFLGLPKFLRPLGTYDKICLGHLERSILLTCVCH
ncbi:hypothetical protein ANN_16236 [Periplaneta americana]|uniref:Uncharacterized protein n=1 Tax=Periplaneta americana TaxID=6978 RepID=A0ABQ8SJM4_PERAM|nr:hypothetical protein ANN_16236 [Periplaneta americana]